ncbi:MAG: alpha/beta hydrolase [Desulfosarcina sp.]|nr:alpha/beta hydrolase [Desulfobacterales bacterium]
MKDLSDIDYTYFDRPEILSRLFYPREEIIMSKPDQAEDLLIPVEDGFLIGARFHHADKEAPVILYFHGNGEIVSDYDDLGPLYLDKGINFLPVDYRGYGLSTGIPTVTGMMRDAHIIFEFVKNRLKKNSFTGPLIIMGRSLGSASALEIATKYEDLIDGLIIESGFAYALPLLRILGVDVDRLGIGEKNGLRNIDKAAGFKKPFLVIHAEFDHIIPFSDGKALFDASPSTKKNMLMIPGANHNSIFAAGFEDYMQAIQELTGLARNL